MRGARAFGDLSMATRTRNMNSHRIRQWTDGVAFERSRTALPLGFPALPDIPADRYREPEFFALERDALFKRGWL